MSIVRGFIVCAMGAIVGIIASLMPIGYVLPVIQWCVPLLGVGFIYGMYIVYGWRGCALSIVLALWALVMEYIGTTTGWPYGDFHYTYSLAYDIGGHVPITLGLIWPVLVISMAMRVRDTFRLHNILRHIFAGTLALVVLDMFLDPVHVASGIWVYDAGGTRFGVPRTNFLGWIWTGGISMAIVIWGIIHKGPCNTQMYDQIITGYIASGWFMWGYFAMQRVIIALSLCIQ